MLVSLRMPVLVLVLLLGSAGCSSDPPSEPRSTAPTPESTPLADYDTADLTLTRVSFCGRVADVAITRALAAEVSEAKTWRPGGRLPGSKNISNEYGCSWTAGSVSARAWVFVPPITSAQAGHFAADVVDEKCLRVRAAPTVGEPGAAQQCGGTTSIYGLVDDAWVGCEINGLSGPRAADVERVGEWCVGVLEAMRSD